MCGNKTTASGIWRFQELLENGYLTADGKDGAGGYTRHFDKCSGTVGHMTHDNTGGPVD